MKNPLKYLLEKRPLLENIAHISITVGVAFAMVTTIIALVGLHYDRTKMMEDRKQRLADRKLRSAELMLKLDDRLDKYQDIINELDYIYDPDVGETKLLLQPLGKITANDLEGYLGLYDTIGRLMKSDLLTCSMAYDEFSYDIQIACINDKIKNYIMDSRGASKYGKDLWNNFSYLCDHYKENKNPCEDLE